MQYTEYLPPFCDDHEALRFVCLQQAAASSVQKGSDIRTDGKEQGFFGSELVVSIYSNSKYFSYGVRWWSKDCNTCAHNIAFIE